MILNLDFAIQSLQLNHFSKKMTEDHNEEEQMIINQQYKLWKKSAPLKYDLCLTRALQWPSSTFQWLPEQDEDDLCTNHYALIASNASEGQLSELQKIRIKIPKQNKTQAYIESQTQKTEIVQKKTIGSEVNRARYCYADSKIVASTHSNGEILISYNEGIYLKLIGHTHEGFGLSWNPVSYNYLASGQSDKRICIWDVQKTKNQANKLSPFMQILHHSAPVEDVAWHKMHKNIFASCSDDRMVMMWDMRFRLASSQGSCKPLFEIIAHTNEVYSLDFSPFNQFLLLSGSGDENISVWDMRNLTRSVQTIASKGSVVKVQWSPHSMNLFGSCGSDHKVNIWDLSLMTNSSYLNRKEEQLKAKETKQKVDKQKEKGMLFSHQGHRSKLIDFDWNLNERMLIGSTEEANCLQIWEMRKDGYYD